MYKNLADSIATLLSANKIIDINNQEIYSYGLELFLFKFTLYTIILIISLLTNSFLISLVFTASYMILRQYTGGYHCKSSEACMIISVLIYTLMLILYNAEFYSQNLLLINLDFLSYLTIIVKAPVENENKPLEKHEIKKYHILSLVTSTIMISFSVLLLLVNARELLFSISYALTADAVLLLIPQRRKKNEEDNS